METRIKLLLLLVIIVLVIFNYPHIENFFDLGSNMIEFTRLDGSLIKKVKVGSGTSLYDQEVINLFRKDQVIRINIPDNYNVRIIYKFRNESKGFGKTVDLLSGSWDISKLEDNKQIFQIDISYDYRLANPRDADLLIRDVDGNIIYSGSEIIPIDWDLVYTNFGYDDYYIYYPSSNLLKTNYYYNFPRYKLYLPSKRIQRQKYYSTGIRDKFYRHRSDFDTDSSHLLMEPPQRITVGAGKAKLHDVQERPLVRGKGQWIVQSPSSQIVRGKGQWIESSVSPSAPGTIKKSKKQN
jgi:hypothetical protein